MDQKALRLLESRCIQEEPPACQCACPIHVDVRTFSRCMVQGLWEEAWKTLKKTMPFPGILSRICDAPCRSVCKRKEAGDAVEIGLLERACVHTSAPVQRMPVLPRKRQRVAVVGSALSSLTAAWDLVRKGYNVTLLEPSDHMGVYLFEIPDEVLPHSVIETEMEALFVLGVETVCRFSLDWDALEEIHRRFDAVYLGLDGLTFWGECDTGEPWPDVALTRISGLEGVFTGGLALEGNSFSPVWRSAEGRWAATTIDRCLQGVSRTAGREKEKPYSSRLYTAMDDVSVLPAITPQDPVVGYTENEAVQEAGRCLQCECLECVKVCPYLKHFGGYPRKYAREIYNNDSIVMGSHKANRLINSCSLCGLCEVVCPENFAMQTLCLNARQDMVQKKRMPPSAHEFALMDMQFSNSDRFAMTRPDPETGIASHLFFPGCQLCASAPEQVRDVYAHLRRVLPLKGVGIMLGCCNAPAFWAGDDALFQKEFSVLKKQWTALGCPQIIPACATCYQMFKCHLPEAEVISLWQVLEGAGLPAGALPLKLSAPPAIHDPCTTRHEPEIHDSVRRLLDRMEQPFEELKGNRSHTACCGFGGLMQNANPELAGSVVRHLAHQHPADYVTYCAMCRDNLAASGKRALHLLDMIFPNADEADPAGRRGPGWSQRRENRSWLKNILQQTLWKEPPENMEPYESIALSVSPEVQQILENRRILTSDIQRVIDHAEDSGGQKLWHPDTGHFKAAFRLHNTTFWVEYSISENGFTIHNAYSHRMEILRKGP